MQVRGKDTEGLDCARVQGRNKPRCFLYRLESGGNVPTGRSPGSWSPEPFAHRSCAHKPYRPSLCAPLGCSSGSFSLVGITRGAACRSSSASEEQPMGMYPAHFLTQTRKRPIDRHSHLPLRHRDIRVRSCRLSLPWRALSRACLCVHHHQRSPQSDLPRRQQSAPAGRTVPSSHPTADRHDWKS